MSKWTTITRRGFLRRSAALAAGPYVVSSAVLGKDGAVAPSERITLGFIGVGAMGRGHVACCVHHNDAQVLAVCDVDRWRRDHAKAIVEQAYGRQESRRGYGRCRAYRDLRDLLARDDIDAVLIATGDRWHALATILAVRAGKDVYCEKPISKTIGEARAMVRAVRRYGAVFQGGLQQRTTAEFRRACRLVRDGAIGTVRVVYVNFQGTCGDVSLPAEAVPDGLDWNLWLGPAPWHPYNRRFHPYGRPPHVVPWHFCRDFGGGNLTSNTVHSFDVVQWGLGMDDSGPVEITPPAAAGPAVLTYRYANGTRLQVVGAYLDPRKVSVPAGWDVRTRLSNFGAVFVGDDGWIHVGRGGLLVSHPAEIVRRRPEGLDGFRPVSNHHQNWLNCIRSRRRAACDVAIGCRSTTVSHLGCIAHWTGRALRWDPAREVFPGDDEANHWLTRAMREPWRL